MTSETQDTVIERLETRVDELTRERDNLVAVVDILQAISASLHFEEILQTIARKLGEAFGLDRSSIYLAGERSEVRLVASYEDPSVRNLIVDLDRYPELRRAFVSGETVFVPDAMKDPMFLAVRDELDLRNVGSIVVVPIRWRQDVIGAIFLRTERGSTPFSETDVKFCQTIADLTAKALRNAHRFEAMLSRPARTPTTSTARSCPRSPSWPSFAGCSTAIPRARATCGRRRCSPRPATKSWSVWWASRCT